MEIKEIKEFKSFKIKSKQNGFEGEKIHIEGILNRSIIVNDYDIKKSNFEEKGNGRCLHLQLTVDDKKRVLFSGSGYLMDAIEQISKEDLPFTTTIIKKDKRLEFT